jgi:arylsulfatase A-like enzyme
MLPRTTKTYLSILAAILCGFAAPRVLASDSRHVVLIVWDGMRPDFVREEFTPTLWKLAQEGVNFRNHHAVYPSSTNVNGTALATGVYPNHSGLIANHEYRPEIDRKKSIDVEIPAVVRKGDELSGGKYLTAPTIAELVQAADRHTAVAGSKGVALLHDRHADPNRAGKGVTLFRGELRPRDALAPIVAGLGRFPRLPHAQGDAWTTKALTNFLWKDGVPAFSLLWLSEPDATEHDSAPGSKAALAAIKKSDENLALVLSTLDRQGARQTTDIFVVSDHGFSTIERAVDLRKILGAAGFTAVTEFSSEPKDGDVMLAGNGGTVLFYVVNHDADVTRRLVEFLQQSDFAGVIFMKESMPGTFRLEQAKIDRRNGPDVMMAFRWNDKKNQFGVPGLVNADWNRKPGEGTHATLSRFDMHTTLIAAGPDFRRGQTDDLPSGNIDVAPTILRILGITPPPQQDGRILSEAMVNIDSATPKPETETIEAKRKFESGIWRQSLRVSRIESTIYFGEGNGAFVPANR